MAQDSAQIANIPKAPQAKATSPIISAVSATALVSLFVVISVQLLAHL